MILRRYISRRYVSLVQYIFVIAALYALFFVFTRTILAPDPPAKTDDGPVALPQQGRDLREAVPAVSVPPELPLEPQPQKPVVPDTFKRFVGVPLADWEPHEQIAADKLRTGPGEHGAPVILPTNDPVLEKQALELYKANGYNAYISDLIALDRSPKDLRHPDCRTQKYLAKLPTVSVIFPFHEEHNSTLLRSVYSVLNRSPKGLVKEVILVDDFSEKPFLRQPLDDYWKKVGLGDIVKVVRTKKREGLIRGRQMGAEAATGEVLIFLDAHSEADYGWLPPLLEPIANDYRTVVCPFVDIIDCETYELKVQDDGARGSFDWAFNYKRLPLTKEDRKHPTRPFNSPVMAGGYFAISKDWFWELGGYDEGLDIWGGEQYELSFKLWQCHGRMVDAPCSRVAHIYRCKYLPFKNAGMGDFVSRNYKRVAEVWMDEYKEILYKKRPSVGPVDTGDISKQLAVRQRLQCKSFDWFMKNIAFDQDKFYPAVDPPASASGELKHLASGLCIDTQFRSSGQRFGMRKCISDDPAGGGEQNIQLSRWHDLRPKERTVCFDVSTSVDKAPVVLFTCHSLKGNQLFKYKLETSQIFHPISRQCLTGDAANPNEVFMRPCDDEDPNQRWKWQIVDEALLKERQAQEVIDGDP